MPVYRVVIDVTDARALSRPVGSRRYAHSLYQAGRDSGWRRVTEPGHVAILTGYLSVALRADDVPNACSMVGRAKPVPLAEPPDCAAGDLFVVLGATWWIRSATITGSARYVWASAQPRVCSSLLQSDTIEPVPAAPNAGTR